MFTFEDVGRTWLLTILRVPEAKLTFVQVPPSLAGDADTAPSALLKLSDAKVVN
jgi:hypothetical protein